MAVRLRLKRFGRRHRPCYRLSAMDIRAPRDGKAIEELGIVDPLAKESTEQVRLNEQRIKYWLSVGAQPSQTVRSLLRKAGILPAEPPAKRKPANNKPQA